MKDLLCELETKISLLIEDIEKGNGDYKLLAGLYETIAMIREMMNEY